MSYNIYHTSLLKIYLHSVYLAGIVPLRLLLGIFLWNSQKSPIRTILTSTSHLTHFLSRCVPRRILFAVKVNILRPPVPHIQFVDIQQSIQRIYRFNL